MLQGFLNLLEDVESRIRANVTGQMDLFGGISGKGGNGGGDYVLPQWEEFSLLQMLAGEKETTGLYISGHPLSEHDALSEKLKPVELSKIHASKSMDDARVLIFGIVTGKKLKTTKSNDMMAFIDVEDKTATIEMIVFPKTFSMYSQLLNIGSVIVARGRVKTTEEENAQIICEEILLPEEALGKLTDKPPIEKQENPAAKNKRHGLYLKFKDKDSGDVERAVNVLKVFEGDMPVYFYYMDTGKYVRTPNSYWVSVNDVMLRELKRMLGEQSVALI